MQHKALTLSVIATLAACSGSNDNKMDDTTAMGAQTPAAGVSTAESASAAPAVTDPQIAAIVVAANDADIEGGKMAKSKSANSGVKEFAQRMITDHGGVNKAAVALVTKLNVKPEENAVSQQQKESGKQARDTLQKLSGAAFDQGYIANEVTYHENLLTAIDQTLIPSAQNAELKALLVQTRPAVEAHLKHAQTLQASLAKR